MGDFTDYANGEFPEVSVQLDNERLLNQIFIVGEELVSDQTHILTFGLSEQVSRDVQVHWLDGRISIWISGRVARRRRSLSGSR